MRRLATMAVVLAAAGTARAEDLLYKSQLLPSLVKQIPEILKTYDARTGHFGTGIWICRRGRSNHRTIGRILGQREPGIVQRRGLVYVA